MSGTGLEAATALRAPFTGDSSSHVSVWSKPA